MFLFKIFLLLLISCGTKKEAKQNTTNLVFSDVQVVLENSCVSCHGATGASGGVKLHTEVDARASCAKSKNRVSAGTMPPAGTEFSSADKSKLLEWLDAGCP